MSWTDEDRERSYRALCEAMTDIGPDEQNLLLARLNLLLTEAVADATTFERCLHVARAGTTDLERT